MNVKEAEEQLLEIKKIFNSLNKPFWLIAGTLLAAVRDKKFFSWDHDMDIAMLADDWTPDFGKYFTHYFHYGPIKYGLGRTTVFDLNRMKNGELDKTRTVRTNIMLAFYNPEYDVYIQIFPPMLDSYLTVIPAHYMDTPNYIDFLGESFRIPNKPEEVLENIYGDWKTPIKSGVSWKERWKELDGGKGKYLKGIVIKT